LYNATRAEVASYNRGEPYWTNVKVGISTFLLSFAEGLIKIKGLPSPLSSIATGAVSAGGTEASIEYFNKEPFNANKIAGEAGKGALLSTTGAISEVAAYSAGLTEGAATVINGAAQITVDATNVVKSNSVNEKHK
jgi:hypothetical protein